MPPTAPSVSVPRPVPLLPTSKNGAAVSVVAPNVRPKGEFALTFAPFVTVRVYAPMLSVPSVCVRPSLAAVALSDWMTVFPPTVVL